MAKMAGLIHELSMLSGDSYVAVELLLEDEELVKLVSQKTPYDELLEYINQGRGTAEYTSGWRGEARELIRSAHELLFVMPSTNLTEKMTRFD